MSTSASESLCVNAPLSVPSAIIASLIQKIPVAYYGGQPLWIFRDMAVPIGNVLRITPTFDTLGKPTGQYLICTTDFTISNTMTASL